MRSSSRVNARPKRGVARYVWKYSALTRSDHHGEPEGGWQPDEKLDFEDALAAFTMGAAYAAFEERLKGSIDPGKLADFVILAQDPRELSPQDVIDLKVVATYVGGEPVYEAEAGKAR